MPAERAWISTRDSRASARPEVAAAARERCAFRAAGEPNASARCSLHLLDSSGAKYRACYVKDSDKIEGENL